MGNFNRQLGSGLALRNGRSDSPGHALRDGRPRMELSSGWLLASNTRRLLLGLPRSHLSTWLHSFHLAWSPAWLLSLGIWVGSPRLPPSRWRSASFPRSLQPWPCSLSSCLWSRSQGGSPACTWPPSAPRAQTAALPARALLQRPRGFLMSTRSLKAYHSLVIMPFHNQEN